MKASGLMIGDWVLVNGTPIQIQAVNDIDGEIMAGDELYCLIEDRVHSEDKIEPIPLTAEILEKNGFEEIKWNEFGEESSEGKPTNIFRCELETKCLMIKVEVGIYKPNFIIIPVPDDCGGEVEIANICKIDGSDIMLHELQHALRLCGIEKTIEL